MQQAVKPGTGSSMVNNNKAIRNDPFKVSNAIVMEVNYMAG
jgi:hypothetical protein